MVELVIFLAFGSRPLKEIYVLSFLFIPAINVSIAKQSLVNIIAVCATCGCQWYAFGKTTKKPDDNLFCVIYPSHNIIFQSIYVPFSQKNLSIAANVGFAGLEVWMPFVTAMNAACAFQLVCLIHINVSRTSTKTIALFVERICFRRVSLPRICHVAMPFMLIVFANWLDSIIAALFAKKRLFRSSLWQLHGRHVLGISQNIPCLVICNVLSI
jgi:hypothetical protein